MEQVIRMEENDQLTILITRKGEPVVELRGMYIVAYPIEINPLHGGKVVLSVKSCIDYRKGDIHARRPRNTKHSG